jgi:hypothetical protein
VAAVTHVHSTKEIAIISSCVRQWAAKYLHRLPEVKTPQQQAGIDVHRLLEAMLKTGPAANVDPESDHGSWARALYPLAPAGAHAELAYEYPFGAHVVSNKLDWVAPDWSEFGDFKTCAGPKWALAGPDASPAAQQTALDADLQANVEAQGFMTITSRDSVPVRWCYVDKRNPKSAWTVRGLMRRERTSAFLAEKAAPWMRLIESLREAYPRGSTPPPVQSFPPDALACDGSGRRCSFLGACQFRPANITTDQLIQLSK